MKGRLIYYLVIIPLSKCPHFVIDFFGYILYVALYRIVGYRKKVIETNLKNSFPEKSDFELKAIKKKFYRHLANVIIDGVRAFSISKDELRESLKCENPEILRKHYDEGRSVLITVGHYSSWELFLAGVNLFIRHRAVVIYQPLSDKFLDGKLHESRSDFRTILIPTKGVREFFNSEKKDPFAIAFAIDQSPANPEKCYWSQFLNQETAIHFGAEKYAKEHNLPVYFACITQTDKHQYTLRFQCVTTNPGSEPHGFITEESSRILEEQIRSQPEFWLWSHKRWKHKRPAGF